MYCMFCHPIPFWSWANRQKRKFFEEDPSVYFNRFFNERVWKTFCFNWLFHIFEKIQIPLIEFWMMLKYFTKTSFLALSLDTTLLSWSNAAWRGFDMVIVLHCRCSNEYRSPRGRLRGGPALALFCMSRLQVGLCLLHARHWESVMAFFTDEQRAWMVEAFFQTNSVQETIRQFTIRYPPPQRAPCPNTVRRNVLKFRRFGTCRNRQKDGGSGRPRSVRTQANIDAVRREIQNNPTSTTRRNNVPITRTTYRRIVSKELGYHPYRMIVRHKLEAGDDARRMQFCQWLTQQPVGRVYPYIVIGDEAAFHLNGQVNSHNVVSYAPRLHPTADFVYHRSNDRDKTTVWAALVADGTVVGPYFFRGNVSGQIYLQMIENDVKPLLAVKYGQRINGVIPSCWWFQDGAPPHRLVAVRTRLQQLFPNRVCALGHNPEWPPRSPDLTPCDFFLWGYLKAKVYITPPRDLDELEDRIRLEFVRLRRTRFVRNSMREMQARVNRCLQRNGSHVEDR